MRSAFRVLVGLLLSAGLMGGTAPAAHASTTWYVSSTGTDVSCSQGSSFLTIQFAIDCSSNGDTVVIGAGTYAQNLTIDVELELVGAGAGSTIIRPTPGAEGSVVYISHLYGTVVSISGVTITGGRSDLFGGGIYNDEGYIGASIVIIRDSVVAGNSAVEGGGIYNEVRSTLGLVNSRVVHNTADDGGGIYNDGGACHPYHSRVVSNSPDNIVGC